MTQQNVSAPPFGMMTPRSYQSFRPDHHNRPADGVLYFAASGAFHKWFRSSIPAACRCFRGLWSVDGWAIRYRENSCGSDQLFQLLSLCALMSGFPGMNMAL